ncbi:MAG: EAL domain-containing protein [Lacipirellulaceae bacterium]
MLDLIENDVATVAWQLCGQLHEDETVRQIRIDSSPFVVGRRQDRALIISTPTVSGVHAELTVQEDGLYVRDLQSSNGTFVNGIRIEDSFKLANGDLVQFAHMVFRVSNTSSIRNSQTLQDDAADRALALIQFDKLVTERAVVPHFQPIVEVETQNTIGYEILGRSRLFGLTSPHAMFSAAAVLGLESELSRLMRNEGVRIARDLPGEGLLFANTHPAEMEDSALLEFSLRELLDLCPGNRLVLEIHEASVTQVTQMRELRAALTDMGIGLAYDDFGAGQARMLELVEVPPDYLKFDIALIRDIDKAGDSRQRMLASLVNMVRDMGVSALAEGVETEGEFEVCQQMGFHHIQGYFFGKPALAKTFGE